MILNGVKQIIILKFDARNPLRTGQPKVKYLSKFLPEYVMDKKGIEILKAKVYFHKTMMTASVGAGITTAVGSWVEVLFLERMLALAAIIFLICALVFLGYYVKRHKELIEELVK